MSDTAQTPSTEKFYQVVDGTGRAFQYHITDYDKAVRVAKKYAAESKGSEVYLMTATSLFRAPVPEAEEIKIA